MAFVLPPGRIDAMSIFSTIKAVSPFGPIFGKELRTTARRKRTYVLRFVYLLVLFLVMLIANQTGQWLGANSNSVAMRAAAEAELAAIFFAAFTGFSLTSLIIISPVLTATTISSERLGRTLPALLMTPISAWQIVAGKLTSRMLTSVMLIGLSLPVLAVVRLLGGVQLDSMFSAICLIFVGSLFAAAVGLFYSCLMTRAYAVILLSYATLLIIYAFLPFVMLLLFLGTIGGSRMGPPQGYLTILMATNPFAAIQSVVVPRAGNFLGGILPCVLVHFAATVLLLIASANVIRRRARREGEGGSAESPVKPSMPISLPPPLPASVIGVSVVNPSSASSSESIELDEPLEIATVISDHNSGRGLKRQMVSDHPVLWRETRRPLMARRWQRITGSIVCVGMLLLTYILIANVSSGSRNVLGDSDMQIGYAEVFCVLLTLLVCVISATTIASEVEGDTWTLLLATPLSAKSIVYGKVIGVLKRLMWPYFLVIGHFTIFTVFQVLSVPVFVMLVWILVTFNSVWVATGMYFSLRCKKVTFAAILNLLMPIFWYGVVALLLALITLGNSDLPEIVLLYAPYFYIGEGISQFERHSVRYDGYNYNGYAAPHFSLPFFRDDVSAPTFLLLIFFIGCLYLLISWLILARVTCRFNRMVERAEQVDYEVPMPSLLNRGDNISPGLATK